ncbi:MAG: hypothetical protein JXR96_07230 [Deltaproteobacteria bacterium]|nr:hypothetical protein [Deltaproteobacteria bacterium]
MKALQAISAALALLASAAAARGGMDSPGSASFLLLADDGRVYRDFDTLPPEEQFVEGFAEAFFSSDASEFGEDGALVWIGFEDSDRQRAGTLLFDIDLRRAPVDGETPVPRNAIRASYSEGDSDGLAFEGVALDGEIWIVDALYHSDDEGALEGEFVLIFEGRAGGSRVFIQGHFISEPSPSRTRKDMGISDPVDEDHLYVETGCSGDVYVADDPGSGCDCGGEDTEGGGCEGDSGGGCEGDGGEGGGCEGDAGGSGGCDGGGGGGCEGGGDVGGGCGGGGGGDCATAGRVGSLPMRALSRLFPELSALVFIAWMRRRRR